MKIETKYNTEDEVYVMHDNKIQCGTIHEVYIKKYGNFQYITNDYKGRTFISYKVNLSSTCAIFDEKKVYKTKEELIKSL